MTQIDCIILFDGTSDDLVQPNTTNIAKLYQGLEKNKQIVIYESGIGNNLQWKWWLPRMFAYFTGYGGGWVMDRAYDNLTAKIKAAINAQTLKDGDTLRISVMGFSRGAALARHFVNAYVGSRFKTFLSKKINVNVVTNAEYLFDTVAAFGIPLHIKLANWLGIKLQNNGWNFSIPKDTKAYHALSIDERRWAFIPTLINYIKGKIQEIWFAGDHSSVGGGHQPPKPGAAMGDKIPLQYIVKSAIANGIQFTKQFLDTLSLKTKLPLGSIQTPTYDDLPKEQRNIREIYVQKNDEKSDLLPTLDESVIRRMQDSNANYAPISVKNLEKFYVHQPDEQPQHYQIMNKNQILSPKTSSKQKNLTVAFDAKKKNHSQKAPIQEPLKSNSKAKLKA